MSGLSVIIPFHRGTASLCRCLIAVRESVSAAGVPCEIIVAADGTPAGEGLHEAASAAAASVVALSERSGPAAARNRAAATATGDVLVFVDADVVIARDALGRIADFFARDPSAAAVFGRYDDTPSAPGLVSRAKNLAHAYVHLTSNRSATTFWAGLGAIRRGAFEEVGGFDERFTRPSVEDIELGYRLSAAGHRIAIEPDIQGQHLKRWSFGGAFLSDVVDRGVPWTRLLHRYKQLRPDLNLTYRGRLAVGSAGLFVFAVGAALWLQSAAWLVAALCAAATIAVCDAPLLQFLAGRGGWAFAVRAVPWRIAHHIASGLAWVVGTVLAAVVDAPREVRAWRFACACLAVLAVALAGRGLRETSTALVGGDEVRYAMNGVFLHDAIADGAVVNPTGWLRYAVSYYTRYPALSLGYHPPLLPLAMVPSVWLLGVGIPAARLPVVCLFAIAVLCLASLVRRTAGMRAGVVAGALCATNPLLVAFGQMALSEVPALAMMLWSLVMVVRFCEHQRRRDLVGFVIAATASVYAKQLAAMLIPVCGLYVLVALGWRRATRVDVLAASGAIALLCAPVVPMTLWLSAHNVAWVAEQAMRTLTPQAELGSSLRASAPVLTALTMQFAWPVLAAAAAGAVLVLTERRRVAVAWIGWAVAAVACLVLVTADVEPARYGIYLMPPVIAFAAVSTGRPSRRRVFELTGLALAGSIVVWQAAAAVSQVVSTAPGYEAAARWVLERTRDVPVLYSSELDSGLFVFHARSVDRAREAVVLRADKILTTYATNRFLDDRVSTESEISLVLRRFGVRYVIVEDRETRSRAMNLLREFVRGTSFIERYRVAVGTSDPRLEGVDLIVYEYLDAGPPDVDAPIAMDVSAQIAVPSLSLRELSRTD